MSYGLLIDDTLVACIAGGTVVSVVEDIISRGGDPSNMIVVCVVACPPALKQLSEKFVGETSIIYVAEHTICTPDCEWQASML